MTKRYLRRVTWALGWKVVLSHWNVLSDSCCLALAYSLVRGLSFPPITYETLLLSKSQTCFLYSSSVQPLWDKNKIPVNLLTAPFVFCGVVKLKTTSTNTLIIKRALGTHVNNAKAVHMRGSCILSNRTSLLEWSSFTNGCFRILSYRGLWQIYNSFSFPGNKP